MARTPAKKAKKSADPTPKDSTADDAAGEESEDEVELLLQLPPDEDSFSVSTRDAFRSKTAQGRFFVRKSKVEANASVILARLHNGHLRDEKGFKRQFKRAFAAWASKPTRNTKKSRSQLLVSRYSEFLSTIVTSIKKWHEHKTSVHDPDEAQSAFEAFVLVSRVRFAESISDIMFKPGSLYTRLTEAQSMKNLKQAYKVSFCCFSKPAIL
jgi:hypothetical protein